VDEVQGARNAASEAYRLVGELASTAQRCNSPQQGLFQRFLRLLEGDITRTPAQAVAMAAVAIRAYPALGEVAPLQDPMACGFQTRPAHGVAGDRRQSFRRNRHGGDQETSRENARDLQQIRSETGSVMLGERSGPRPTHREKESATTVL